MSGATPVDAHQPLQAVHADARPWETLRWPGQWSKMLFHPRAERPTRHHGLLSGPALRAAAADVHGWPPFNMTARESVEQENLER